MTDAQWREEARLIAVNANYVLRKFRKECVAQGIVKFTRDGNFYEMEYRGSFVCYLYGNSVDNSKLMAVWNTIKIAEETIEKIEGVKHESN